MKHPGKLHFRDTRRPSDPPKEIIRERGISVLQNYCKRPEKDGVGCAGQFMFPAAGVVKSIHIRIDSLKDDKTALLDLAPESDQAGEIRRVEIKAGDNVIPYEIEVAAGHRLYVNVEKPQVDGVWFSAVYEAKV